ncbi:hypothetical protein C2I36_00485 [Rhodobacteraceae bacterium WD3A24]|nr:hypothetical protein C2I36_00485 [Rhodobacteraceae bacterium WD3A24]
MELAVELGSVIARDCARRDPAGPPDPHPLTALCTALMIAAARPAQRIGLAAEIADLMEGGAAPSERAAGRTK